MLYINQMLPRSITVRSDIDTTPALTELNAVLHFAEEKGEWPDGNHIAELASTYAQTMGREIQGGFDVHQLKQQTFDEQLASLRQELETLKSLLAHPAPSTNTTQPASPLQEDTFTPDQHRNLIDQCFHPTHKKS